MITEVHKCILKLKQTNIFQIFLQHVALDKWQTDHALHDKSDGLQIFAENDPQNQNIVFLHQKKSLVAESNEHDHNNPRIKLAKCL